MSMLSDIENKNISPLTHKFFTRFGRGRFEKEVCNVRTTKKEVKFDAGYEYSSFLIDFACKHIEGMCNVDGKFVSLNDSTDLFSKYPELELTKNNKAMTKVEFKGDIESSKLKEFAEVALMSGILLMNFQTDKLKLKMKKSIPKPGKLQAKFCALSMSPDYAEDLRNEFFPDSPETFKKGTVQHTYLIEEIDIPEEYKNDFALAKQHAIRIGTIERTTDFDGNEQKVEIPFRA